jgi:hypothetical protein
VTSPKSIATKSLRGRDPPAVQAGLGPLDGHGGNGGGAGFTELSE